MVIPYQCFWDNLRVLPSGVKNPKWLQIGFQEIWWVEWWEYNEAVHQLFIDFKKAHDSVRREALYNILIEFGIPKKLVRLVNMCLTETYSRVRVGKNLSDMFPIRNGLKRRCSIAIAFQRRLGVCH